MDCVYDSSLIGICRKSVLCVLTGPVNSGKSSYAKKLIELLRTDFSVIIGGIINYGIFRAGRKVGYQCEDLLTGIRHKFAIELKENTSSSAFRIRKHEDVKVGSWFIFKEGLQFAIRALEQAIVQKAELIVVDEFGILERDGQGLRSTVNKLINTRLNSLIIVRQELLKEVTEIYKLYQPMVVYLDELKGDTLKLKESCIYKWFATCPK
ncbi:MAG: nucleoside-triphosphatase [Candidatus Sumerlaeia bacterium]|nr:nucleoside-triphosphatase [Candidatus Sumerlaeia bacterium]